MNALSILVDGLGMGILMNTLFQPAPVGCRYLRELYFNPQVNILFVFAFVWKGYIQVVMTAWHDNRMVVTFTAIRVKIINKSNFQCQPAEEQIMPRVIACLLRHLPLLQVQLVGLCNTIVISSFH